jgi:hypothetical protein
MWKLRERQLLGVGGVEYIKRKSNLVKKNSTMPWEYIMGIKC